MSTVSPVCENEKSWKMGRLKLITIQKIYNTVLRDIVNKTQAWATLDDAPLLLFLGIAF